MVQLFTMDTLYREEILEHYRSPLHFEKLATYDVKARQVNPFCGDEIEMFLAFSGTRIENIGFQGSGCAISIASASLLTDFALHKQKAELTTFSEEDMLDLLNIEVSETRKKCAFLSLAVLKECL